MSEYMPEDPTQVAGWIQGKATDLKQHYKGRTEMFDFDRRLLMQEYKQTVKGQANIISAEPRNMVRLALDIMTRKGVLFHALIHDQDMEEQQLINDIERLATGLWRSADRTWRSMGNRPLIRDIDWYILMGGYAVNPLMYQTDKGTAYVVRVLDPRDVYPEYDDSGVSWVCHSYKTPLGRVKPRWAEKSGWDLQAIENKSDRDEIEVINSFWLQDGPDGHGVYNCIVADGKLVKPPTYEKQFGMRLPIITGPASGNPVNNPWGDLTNRWTGEVSDSIASQWEGILAPARQSYVDLDSLLSYQAEIVRRNALGRYVQRTRNGMPRVSPQQFKQMELGTLQVGEDIIPVPPPTSPNERNELMQYLLGSIQRSGLSFTAFGSIGLEISGVTLDSLINATQSVLSPFIDASQFVVSESILSLVDQIRLGSFGKISVEVQGRDASATERWFIKDFTKKDLPKTLILNATQALSLPDTALARINAARTAIGDNRPLLSEQSISEHLLQDMIPDYQLNQSQMAQDTARNSPQAAAIKIIQGLRDAAKGYAAMGDDDTVQLLQILSEATVQQFQQQYAGMQERVAGIEAQRQAQGGPALSEPAPDQLPPEASGVRPEAVDEDRGPAGNASIRDLILKRAASVNGGR